MFETRDVERLQQVARDASAGRTFEARYEALSASLAELIPCMAMTAIVVRPGLDGPPGQPRAFMRDLDPRDAAAYAERYVQHDPCPAAAVANPFEPIALSDLVPAHRFGGDPYTGDLLSKRGIRHVMGVLVPVPDGWLSLGLHRERGRRDFTRREREVLRLVAPDLARAALDGLAAERVAALARPVDADEGAAGGTLLFDEHGELVHADPGALALVRRLGPGGDQPPDELLADARWLVAPGAPGQRSRERALSTADGGVVMARSTVVELAPHRCVLTTLRPIASPERALRQLATRWGLTRRELEVTRLAAEGRSNAEIARRLEVATATINVHLQRVYRKGGLSGRGELIRRVAGR